MSIEENKALNRQVFGAMIDIPPTGKQVMVTGIVITHFAIGKAVEVWKNADDLVHSQETFSWMDK